MGFAHEDGGILWFVGVVVLEGRHFLIAMAKMVALMHY
jgi:hypothetical protein